MKNVVFYLFTEPDSDTALGQHEYVACQKAFAAWQQQTRVLIACQTKEQAEKLDEYLWQFDTSRFLPHNLVGEGPATGSPIELCWPGCQSSSMRQLLINLQDDISNDVTVMFNNIIDFVPFKEQDKAQARARYKVYKKLGFNLKIKQVKPIKSTM